MTIITRETFTGEIEVEVLDTKKSKKIMKQALVKAFGLEKGEYLYEYGAIYNGLDRVSITLNQEYAKDLKRAF